MKERKNNHLVSLYIMFALYTAMVVSSILFLAFAGNDKVPVIIKYTNTAICVVLWSMFFVYPILKKWKRK